MTKPLVTIIVPTYNRAHTLKRCIKSVLLQTHANLDVLIIDDGSEDSSIASLGDLQFDSRLRVISHAQNRGVAAAINTGFDNIKGQWFTLIGSDDEMVEEAIEAMLNVLNEVDSDITAITCNCIDTTTGEFSGKGLDASGYISWKDVLIKSSGEHWGITKTSLLGLLRLDERVRGGEGILWYKINRKAKRFYIHKAFRIYHTEGDDRICAQKPLNLIELARAEYYRSTERKYIEALKKWNTKQYYRHLFYLSLYFISQRHLAFALKSFRLFVRSKNVKYSLSLFFAILFGLNALQHSTDIFFKIKNSG